ncbi:LamB/YcsF family protein [Clostridium pasteurianum]|uniref:LamB/YcsF family protein n=1 Tax=Clostridium pasteurianum TaxID=1501 RepID=UPI002260C0FF|nr:5-oxoprolinase subunit PxpA [Clostridium pasteurianum]UZW14188.1 LamB/YcsF family protein [Clostridium pasteurianum]
MYKVDLNCDLGESFGVYKLGNDELVLPYITSANIACGFHAGDPSVMRKTVKLALLNNVAIGAHPGIRDLVGFGRRNINISPEDAYNIVVYQIGALYGFVKSEGSKVQHVKPHGALYNIAARDSKIARAVAEAVYKVDPELILFGLAGSELIIQGEKVGVKIASEVFADRTYQRDGSLTSRSNPEAMITNTNEAVTRVVRMIKEGLVKCQQGKDIEIKADTVCVHGDGKHALEFTSQIKESLEKCNIEINNFSI